MSDTPSVGLLWEPRPVFEGATDEGAAVAPGDDLSLAPTGQTQAADPLNLAVKGLRPPACVALYGAWGSGKSPWCGASMCAPRW